MTTFRGGNPYVHGEHLHIDAAANGKATKEEQNVYLSKVCKAQRVEIDTLKLRVKGIELERSVTEHQMDQATEALMQLRRRFEEEKSARLNDSKQFLQVLKPLIIHPWWKFWKKNEI